MERKICGKCGIEKGLSSFYQTKRNKSGYRETCKVCYSDYNKNQNVKRKSDTYEKRVRLKFNEKYFEKIDSTDKAYFLGLVYSDGSVLYDKTKSIYGLVISLHKKDRHILEDFIRMVDGELGVWDSSVRDICQVRLNGKKMSKDLVNIGCEPNKTFTIEYPDIPKELERHFLRGYFDGDGCVRINSDKRDGSKRGDLRIVGGSEKMINKINERMNILFGSNINKLYGPKGGKYKFIGWSGMSDIEKIYEGFYRDTDLFLNRKKLIFDEVIDIIKNKRKYRKK